MRAMVFRTIMFLGVAVGLAACGGGTPDLITLQQDGDGPDEFAIVPTKPLQAPENLDALPPPTPGGTNRTDPTPDADAVAALGGNPAATRGGGVQGPALMDHVRRFGVTSDIRRTLAVEDIAFRRANSGRALERLFNTTIYYRAYAPQSLDQYRELERLRRSGIRTPAAPPPEVAR